MTDIIEHIMEVFMTAVEKAKRKERFTVGRQPCDNFLRGDADIAALGEGNHMNLHQCPKCEGNRAWCDNCHSDHHDGGWETCKLGAYADPVDEEDHMRCCGTVEPQNNCS